MDFYLSYNNNEEQLRLPVTPSDFELSQRNNNTVININALGEINLIGKKGLASISLSSFFPAQEYYFCKYTGFPKPYECVKMIQKWRDSGRPIRLIITGTSINYAMTIENFIFSEQDGTRDVYFTLELREYVFTKQVKPTKVTTPNGTQVTVPATKREAKPIPSKYKAQKGDNMYTVAKKTTGSMSNAKAIAKTNKRDQYKGMDLVKGTVVLI
ncbi:hypothetical protein [Zhenhengia yiwuensis]|uniref:LysM domain-containing protein n=1 Tax=Zhenhengia yiwuensis TaxID=2763666 RepID=A0A926EJ19_9FIRM|nr:hypothetical protein [Zhenhengia yiwuensis]MBC8579910.1 hypothetical protein [Zhenhengia yiwuensis]